MKDKIEKYYDEINIEKSFKQIGLLANIKDKLNVYDENRVDTAARNFPRKVNKYLDIGCNTGTLLIKVHDNYKFGYGADISSKTIRFAQKKFRKIGINNVSFIQMDIENKYRYPNNFFNVITMLDVLEHLFDPEAVLKKIYNSLKKGGTFMLSVPNVAWLPRRLTLLFGRRPRTSYAPGWEGGHLQYFTFSELEELLESCGFKILERDCSGIFRNIKMIYPPLLSANIFLVCQKK